MNSSADLGTGWWTTIATSAPSMRTSSLQPTDGFIGRLGEGDAGLG